MKKYLFTLFLFPALTSWGIKPINAVIGDVSYLAKFAILPNDDETNDKIRIQTHLEYVENSLRSVATDHLSARALQNRLTLLDALHDYWNAGQFPQLPKPFESRQPCFIDDHGTLCAVGYLVKQSAGRNVAEEINNKHRFEYLLDMNDPVINSWAEENGFSLTELAMIQPTYGWEPEPHPIEILEPPMIEIPMEEVLRSQLAALQVKYDSSLVQLQRAKYIAERQTQKANEKQKELEAAQQKNLELEAKMEQERALANATIKKKKRFNYVLGGVAVSLGTLAGFQWFKIRNAE